ncbi:class I SAM-dependent methyltransferase [Peristeroidobacter agariperforans]|uniref:class I SAM-dependent methyltransferase n=1 Tax=Peristeroidobacter agariperforans TaxID=268404 RepID=UPI00101E2064|nr:class I SAM-dependent methyltransferase [Peristeroidobacter agariperforans]
MTERGRQAVFSDRVQAYVRARPRYPKELATLLMDEFALTSGAAVADIGSGTGLSSEPFLRAGCLVSGVEPDDAMRAAAERELAAYAGFTSVKGHAEGTALRASSMDLIVAGQAFHWFEPAKFRIEALRISRTGGCLGLFWNTRQHEVSPFMSEYNETLLRCCTEYREKWGGRDVRDRRAPALDTVFGSGRWRETQLPNGQSLTLDLLIARVESDAYAPKPGHPEYELLTEGLTELFHRHAAKGLVELQYRTRIFLGRIEP